MGSLAGGDIPVEVRGGNWQIFEQFVKRSGANKFLNTTVCVSFSYLLTQESDQLHVTFR